MIQYPQMTDIVPVYKPEGMTPSQLITLFRKRYPLFAQEKISPAGRLDPMAEGLLLLLVGNANKKRDNFLRLNKTYTFTILFGITTDTYDILGKIHHTTNEYSASSIIRQLPELLAKMKGTQHQTYPPFSSKTLNGKPLFSYARAGQLDNVVLPQKEIAIEDITLQGQSFVEKQKLLEEVLSRIAAVNGDFRQDDIVKKWQVTLPSLPDTLLLADCMAEVSSGTYIRSLCHSLGEKLGCGAIAYSIKRTTIGKYSLRHALYLT